MQLHARPLAGPAPAQAGHQCAKTAFRSAALPTAAARPAPRAAPLAVQASLDSSGLTSSNSSLLGPAAPGSSGLGGSSSLGPKLNGAKPSVSIEDVPLESGVGVDYSKMQALLKDGAWREAEDELRAKLIEASGPGALGRGWVYWSEVKSIPVEDMRTMDALWAAASGGRFGYKVQREVWIQNRRQWQRFFKAIDWVQGPNNVYRKWPGEFTYTAEAPKGHLPLTNALRGTRLFEAVMEHPAFAAPAAGGGAAGGAPAGPSWLK